METDVSFEKSFTSRVHRGICSKYQACQYLGESKNIAIDFLDSKALYAAKLGTQTCLKNKPDVSTSSMRKRDVFTILVNKQCNMIIPRNMNGKREDMYRTQIPYLGQRSHREQTLVRCLPVANGEHAHNLHTKQARDEVAPRGDGSAAVGVGVALFGGATPESLSRCRSARRYLLQTYANVKPLILKSFM